MKAFSCKTLLSVAALVLSIASAAPAHATYISYRSHDAGVEAAQMRLKQLGYFVGKVDGINGPRTSNALAAFQRNNGLMVTGNYDYYTQAALFPVYQTPYYTSNVVVPTMAYPVAYTVPLNEYRAGAVYAQPIAYAAQLPTQRPIAQTYAISEAVRYGNWYTPAGSQITTVVPRPW
ncbi:MAG: peptidoglycan-binding domain-containing protein [Alphaproteobacteria bacterium]|nr:peptidoglycan-binding domain-containing protein [Alphaproteobacteria bacterium]